MGSNFIGIDGLCYAILTKDDTTGVVYQAVKPLAPAAKIAVDSDTAQAPFYADGVLQENNSIVTGGKISLAVGTLPLSVQADLFGHQLDGKGGLISNKNDKAPYVALLYRRIKGNGKVRYMKIYKTQFQEPKQDAETVANNVKVQNDTLEGIFMPRIYDGNYQYKCDEEEPNFVDVKNTFFTAIDTADATSPTIASTVPAANATAVSVNTTYQWVFNEPLAPGTVTAANFYLIKDSDGSMVGANVAYNDSTKTVTLTPAAALSSATKYMAVADSDVTDLAGNHLVQVNKFFTTA